MHVWMLKLITFTMVFLKGRIVILGPVALWKEKCLILLFLRPKGVMVANFLHTPVKKIELSCYSVVMHKSYLTLLVWLLIQDKKSTRVNSIVSTALRNGVQQN